MSKIGVSSSCFYPLETEESFIKIAAFDVSCAEVFFNSPSELSAEFIRSLNRRRSDAGIQIAAVHPFMSFAESFFLFSSYERRFLDMLPFYERFFEITKELGADIFIFHGAKPTGSVDDEIYFERFAKLTEIGRRYEVQVCQENVVHYKSESPDFLKKMAEAIGDDFGMVLDVKQARRAGYSYHDFLKTMSRYIRHVHVSDYTEYKDCVTPGDGVFDFGTFFAEMTEAGYDGAYIIELYKDSYKEEKDVGQAYKNLKKILLSSGSCDNIITS